MRYTGLGSLVGIQKRPSLGRFWNGTGKWDFPVPSFSMACTIENAGTSLCRTRARRLWTRTRLRWIAPLQALLLSIPLLAPLALVSTPAYGERVKDLAAIEGIRRNQLLGYGLVVGLDGTGDKDTDSPYTLQSLRNMMTRLGIVVPPGVKLKPKNIALVSLQATLHPFSKIGQTIDVTAASIGNAKSLRGGTLLLAPLRGADGRVYAMAQGNLIVSGLSASGADGSKVTVNVPQVGRIPNGATVERNVDSPFGKADSITLNLHNGDFTTAKRMADVINGAVGSGVARPFDATSVRVSVPRDPAQRVSFLALVQELEVIPAATKAKVIVNTRTGTVVINSEVRISPAAVSHGNLVVSVSENQQASQPAAFARRGQTVVTEQSDISITEDANRMFAIRGGVSLDELVEAVNRVGIGPSDLVAILEALKEAGALHAELLVI